MVAASREKHSSLFAPVVLCLAALAGCKAAWNAIRDYRESFADGAPMKEGQLVGDVVGEQVAPGREQLTKFNEYWAKIFQRSTQAFTSRGRGGHRKHGEHAQQ